MTLQEAKDQIAQKYGYKNWKAFVSNEIHKHATTTFWGFINEAAELYAESKNKDVKNLIEIHHLQSKELEEEILREENERLKNYADSEIEKLQRLLYKKNSRWISVKDKLPELRSGWSVDDVICITDNYYIGRFRYGKWVDMENRPIIGVTHWMPLPSPPQQ
jgi:tRNA G10  N-methylase Trm11